MVASTSTTIIHMPTTTARMNIMITALAARTGITTTFMHTSTNMATVTVTRTTTPRPAAVMPNR